MSSLAHIEHPTIDIDRSTPEGRQRLGSRAAQIIKFTCITLNQNQLHIDRGSDNNAPMWTSSALSTLAPAVPAVRAAPTKRSYRHRTRYAGAVKRAAGDDAGEALTEEQALVQWMCINYRPWVKDEEGAVKCINFMKEKEGRMIKLEKAKEVMESIKADHKKQYQERIPFELPKMWPGFQHILSRSSDPI